MWCESISWTFGGPGVSGGFSKTLGDGLRSSSRERGPLVLFGERYSGGSISFDGASIDMSFGLGRLDMTFFRRLSRNRTTEAITSNKMQAPIPIATPRRISGIPVSVCCDIFCAETVVDDKVAVIFEGELG